MPTCEYPQRIRSKENSVEAAVPAAQEKRLRATRPPLQEEVMLYMVIERFKDAPAIYQRLREKGRMMPAGLNYVSSWIDQNLKTCWQIMETDDIVLLQRWIDNWKDLMDFEIIPVRTSAEVVELMKRQAR
jgi:hypothetical protein